MKRTDSPIIDKVNEGNTLSWKSIISLYLTKSFTEGQNINMRRKGWVYLVCNLSYNKC